MELQATLTKPVTQEEVNQNIADIEKYQEEHATQMQFQAVQAEKMAIDAFNGMKERIQSVTEKLEKQLIDYQAGENDTTMSVGDLKRLSDSKLLLAQFDEIESHSQLKLFAKLNKKPTEYVTTLLAVKTAAIKPLSYLRANHIESGLKEMLEKLEGISSKDNKKKFTFLFYFLQMITSDKTIIQKSPVYVRMTLTLVINSFATGSMPQFVDDLYSVQLEK